MKISKIIFPLMMVMTMTSCIAGEAPKAIDYDTFIAAAQEEEAKESPYTKATVKYDIHENASSISSGERVRSSTPSAKRVGSPTPRVNTPRLAAMS